MDRRQSSLRNMLSSGVASWAEFFLGMLASILIARSLLPEQYGHFSFMMWCATFFVIASNGGLSTGVIKFVAESNSDDRRLVLAWLARIQMAFQALVSMAAIAGYFLFRDFFAASAPPLVWALLLAASLLKAGYIFWMSASQGEERFSRIARVVLFVAPINLALNAWVAWLDPTVMHFVMVYLVTSLAYRLMIAPTRIRADNAPDQDLRARIRRHLWITGASIVLSFMVLRQSEVFFLRLFADSSDIAFFTIAYTIGFALAALIPGAYASLLLPMMSRQSTDSDRGGDSLQQALRYLMLLAAPMAVGTWLLGDALIQTLYGPAYMTAAGTLRWVIGGVAISAVCQAAVSLLVSRDQQTRVLLLNLASAAAVVLVDILLIFHFGLAGAGPAFLVGCLVHGVLMSRAALSFTGSRWPWRNTVRTVAAAAIPAAPVWLILVLPPWQGAPIWPMLLAALTYTALYPLSSLITGCWSDADLERMQQLVHHLPAPLAQLGVTVLRKFR
ncbi:MAG: lipopolysaccharide biosynthesis protein [Alcanivoracaceae bacterium]